MNGTEKTAYMWNILLICLCFYKILEIFLNNYFWNFTLCPLANICGMPAQTVFSLYPYIIIYFACWCSVSPAAGAVSHRSKWSVREDLRPADAQPSEGNRGGGGGWLTRQLGQVFLFYSQTESHVSLQTQTGTKNKFYFAKKCIMLLLTVLCCGQIENP